MGLDLKALTVREKTKLEAFASKIVAIDVIGIPVNICSKINPTAPINGAIIGSDLYQLVKDFDDYSYNQIKAYSVGLKQSYPIYSVQRKK